MTALAVAAIVAQLSDAGFKISLVPAGGLAVAPASHLTAELRDLIRSSKTLLIDWLTAANDAPSHTPEPPDNPVDWKELAATYYAHHFNCPACIAAGRGSRYGRRCGAGMALWQAYCECSEPLI